MPESLYDARIRKGFTQDECAKAMDVNTSTYSRLEKTPRKMKVDQMQALVHLMTLTWTEQLEIFSWKENCAGKHAQLKRLERDKARYRMCLKNSCELIAKLLIERAEFLLAFEFYEACNASAQIAYDAEWTEHDFHNGTATAAILPFFEDKMYPIWDTGNETKQSTARMRQYYQFLTDSDSKQVNDALVD
mgnify:FL=1|tara:strand:- start:134 stop:703 length:570 start_codon:yes stop_codon:yes gene_type:complete